MTALVQFEFPHDLPLGVLHNSSARLSNAGGKVLHLNDESGDDDANAFTVLLSVGVKGEAGAPASEKFDAGNSVDINIRAGDGLYCTARQFQLVHCSPRDETGASSHDFYIDEKSDALHFRLFLKIARTLCKNANASASFLLRRLNDTYSITHRGSAYAPRMSQALCCEALTAPPVSATNLCDGFLPPSYDRRQLASDDLPVIARTFIHARGKAQRFNLSNENPIRTDSDRLPGFGCHVREKSSPHGDQSTMRRFAVGQNLSEGEIHV